MIVALEGILEYRDVDYAIIKVGPISLNVNIPSSTLSHLGSIGDAVRLHTHLYLREDNITLYGFASDRELGLFRNLITVSGIGPRAALGLLSAFNPEKLASAIVGSNVDLLSQVPGIGKKTAGRIVLELKSKLEKEFEGFVMPTLEKQDADVISALTSLGYSVKEATEAVSSISGSQDLDLEERVRLALQKLSTV